MPGAVWPLFIGTLINRFGGFVLVFLVLYLRSRGYSPAAAGGSVGAYGLGALAAAPLGGSLADRYGRRNSIVASMIGSAAAMLLLWQASSLAAIVALAAAAGLFGSLYRPAASALLADIVPSENRLVGFAVYRFAVNLGMALGPVSAGLLARHGFGLLFIGDALTSLACGMISFLWLPRDVLAQPSEETRSGATRTILGDRPFMLFLAASVTGALVYAQMTSTLPLAVVADGHSRAFYGLLISLNGALVILVEVPLVGVTRRLPARLPIAVGYLLVGVGFALTGASPAAAVLVSSVIVWTFGEILGAPVVQAYVAELSPEHARGRYAAALGLTFAGGDVVGPVLGTTIYGWHPRMLWLCCLVFGALASLLAAGARPQASAQTIAEARPAAE